MLVPSSSSRCVPRLIHPLSSSESTITPIPFQASTASVNLSLSLAFQPELSIDVTLSSSFAQAGIALDLPSFDVEISPVSSVDSNCESDPTKYVFSDLTHIVPNVAINVSFLATAGLDIADIAGGKKTSYGLAGTAFSLPTACLSFDLANGVFTTPTVPTTTAAASGAKANAGHGRSADNPFEKGATRAGSGLWNMMGGLISTLIAMVLL